MIDNVKRIDKFKVCGHVTRNLYDEKGSLIETHENENLIVDSGKNRIMRNIYDGTPINLVGCLMGRDSNTPMNLTNDSGWIPEPPRPEDKKSTIVGDGTTNARQQSFNKIEFLDKAGNVIGYKTDTVDTMTNATWANVMSVRYYVLFKSSDVNMIVNCVGMIMDNNSKTSENLFSKHTFPWMYLKSDRGYSLEIIWTYNIL